MLQNFSVFKEIFIAELCKNYSFWLVFPVWSSAKIYRNVKNYGDLVHCTFDSILEFSA